MAGLGRPRKRIVRVVLVNNESHPCFLRVIFKKEGR